MDLYADPVNHPAHYANNKINGKECIDITRHFMFSPGNAIKYVWRAGYKIDDLEDLAKADFYINDAEKHKGLVGTTAMTVAQDLLEATGMSRREAIVIDLIASLAYEEYAISRQCIDHMRTYIKEGLHAI